MTPTPKLCDGDYSIVDVSVREAQRVPALQQLLARCAKVDQRPPLGDHALSVRTTIEPAARAFAVVDPSSLVVAYAQATPTSETSPTWTIDLAIDPNHRHAHDPITDSALTAGLAWVRARGGRGVQWWKHEPTDSDRTIAELHGLRPERQLLEMHTQLNPTPPNPAITTRSFVMSVDEPALLELNNLAFAHHPDQGNWTHDSLIGRFNNPWFEPAGLLIHTDDHGTMLGFCWTKVHHRTAAPPLGEIYVLAVRPTHHGRGLGRALTKAGLASLHQRDIEHVMLFVDGANTAACNLYQQLGFIVTATTAAFHSSMAEEMKPHFSTT